MGNPDTIQMQKIWIIQRSWEYYSKTLTSLTSCSPLSFSGGFCIYRHIYIYTHTVYLPSSCKQFFKAKNCISLSLEYGAEKASKHQLGKKKYLTRSLQLANKHVEFNLFHLYENWNIKLLLSTISFYTGALQRLQFFYRKDNFSNPN